MAAFEAEAAAAAAADQAASEAAAAAEAAAASYAAFSAPPAPEPSRSSRPRSALRTGSPERARAAAEAMRRMRAAAAGADDDGLGSGVLGGGALGGGLDPGSSGEFDPEAALEGPGGLRGGSGVSMSGRRRGPLRTASPERARAAAEAMAALRREAGLPPNDGGAAAGSGPARLDFTPTVSPDRGAVLPRDWRRELNGASGSASEPAGTGRGAGPAGGRQGGGRSSRDWRSQVEAGAGYSTAGAESDEAGVRGRSPLLSAAERVERDARLRSWREGAAVGNGAGRGW
jgi:hypothetical protein